MFQLIAQQARQSGVSRRLIIQATAQQNAFNQIQMQNFNSIFGGLFGKKKPEPEKQVEKKEEEKKSEKQPPAKATAVEPTKYHKESVKAGKEKEEEDIKDKIRKVDRTGPNNLFGKYQRQRKTIKEKNESLEDHVHPDLLKNDRVTIMKFENNKFKRGLDEGEEPFPVSPKIGPYIVEKPVFGAKNYFYCTCGLSSNQPFCDSSHKGSAFKPVKFSLDEKSEQLHLCGCKLTTNAPFCDGSTCKKILSGEPFQEAQAALAEHQTALEQAKSQAQSQQSK